MDDLNNLLTDLAQFMDAVKPDLVAANAWSDWDAKMRERITAALRTPTPIAKHFPSPVAAEGDVVELPDWKVLTEREKILFRFILELGNDIHLLTWQRDMSRADAEKFITKWAEATRIQLTYADDFDAAAIPRAWLYRWKLDGEMTKWRVSDASQKSAHPIAGLEEIPLYERPLIGNVWRPMDDAPKDGTSIRVTNGIAEWIGRFVTEADGYACDGFYDYEGSGYCRYKRPDPNEDSARPYVSIITAVDSFIGWQPIAALSAQPASVGGGVPEGWRIKITDDGLISNGITETMVCEMIEALQFYADPSTYFGIMIVADRPTGGFDDDQSEVHVDWHNELDWRPGKQARAVLEKLQTILALPSPTAIEPQAGWRDMESAPRDGTWILGVNNRGNQAVIIWKNDAADWSNGRRSGWIHPFSNGELSAFWNGACGSIATHWQPLPQPPANRRE